MKKILFLSLFSHLVILNLSALTLGVVPQQSPFQLMKVWSPIVTYLEKETGEKIELEIKRSIPSFEKALYAGKYDLAYMNPYHYVLAHTKKGYKAAVRANKSLVGILVLNKESKIQNLSMLNEKSFLFPSPNAFAATLLTKYELLKNYGINVDAQKNFRYVNSHDSVYKGVARKIGDVGGGVERTFNNLKDKESKDALRILYRTKAYPSHPFAYKPSMSKTLQEKLSKALLNMPKNLLDSLSMTKIIETDDAEYDTVRDVIKKLSLEEN